MTVQPVEPVSTRVSRMVPAAKVAQFESLLHDVIVASRGFPGHLGVDVLRPDGGGTYQIVFRFHSRAEYQAWTDSEQRHRLVATIDELLDDGTTAAVRTVDGWEGWFVTAGYAPPVPPKRWKMAALTLGGLYPILVVLVAALSPFTRAWPLPLALLLTASLSIPLMTWVVMPLLTRSLGPWLRR